jgi:hypothetical protein
LWISCGKLCGKVEKIVEIPLFPHGLNIFYASKKCSILWDLNFKKCGFFPGELEKKDSIAYRAFCVKSD